MQIRKESSIKPGDVLVNVFDSNDRVTVSKDSKVEVSVNGNSNKIYRVEKGEEKPDEETVEVSFKIKNADTYWGQNVYLVEVNVKLPKNKRIEFKAIKIDDNGNVVWENGNNRVIETGDSDMNYEFDF